MGRLAWQHWQLPGLPHCAGPRHPGGHLLLLLRLLLNLRTAKVHLPTIQPGVLPHRAGSHRRAVLLNMAYPRHRSRPQKALLELEVRRSRHQALLLLALELLLLLLGLQLLLLGLGLQGLLGSVI